MSQGLEQVSQFVQRQVSAASEAGYSDRARDAAYEIGKSAASGSVVAAGGYVAAEFIGLRAEDASRIEQFNPKMLKKIKL